MKETIEDSIKQLALNAGKATQGVEAMQLSQAALNLAHILATLDNLKQK